jgi:hypothetical protein
MALNSHSYYVRELMDQIRPRYLLLKKDCPLLLGNVDLGDIDVFALNKDTIDIYEVKSTKSIKSMKKAIGQLSKARGLIGFQGSEFVFTPKHGIQPIEEIIRELSK